MSAIACYFFGCWNQAGHFMYLPGGRREWNGPAYYGDHIHLDGTLAPRRGVRGKVRGVEVCWMGQGATPDERQRIDFDSKEYSQGQFLRHVLDNGYTAI